MPINTTPLKPREDSSTMRKNISKATMLLTGAGPPIHKQIKTAITEGNEDKAISLYMSKDGSKVHPSKPFPTKKTDSADDTPLHLAAKHVLMKLFKMFIEYGGNPGVLNVRFENCAHAVCMLTSFPGKRGDILDLIFEWHGTKADNTADYVLIDQVDIEGNTALHIAAFNGLLVCIQKLVLRGATLSLLNHFDLSCAEMADRGGHLQLGTMLELAWVFQHDNAAQDAMATYSKHTKGDNISGRILLDGISVPLTGFIEFMNKSIKIASDTLAESPARAEALLNCYAWDVKMLKKEYTVSKEKVLITARLKPRAVLHQEVVKDSEIECGVCVEEIYLDPCYNTVASFSVSRANKKFSYSFHHFDGKAAVHPLDYNPAAKSADSTKVSPQSHVNPKPTETCLMCGNVMLEPASLHNFLTGTIVEGSRRELPCGSGHKYCMNCWSDHVSVQIKNNNQLGTLGCPSANCGEVLDIQWAPVILKKSDLVNRLMAQRQRHVIEALNLRWCPIQGCGLLVHLQSNFLPHIGSAEPGGTPSIGASSSFASCSPCSPAKATICGNGHAFCLACSQEAHSPCKCSDVTVWNEWLREESTNTDGRGNPLANLLLYYSDHKPCAFCNTVLVKEDGCNIVRCPTCAVQYCWMCMQPWSTHSNRTNSILFCNRFAEDASAALTEGAWEEKSDDIGVVHMKLKTQRISRLCHYAYRHMTHGESMKLESAARKVVEERIYNGLVASFDGDLVWLQGTRVPNPLDGKAAEIEAYNAIRGLESTLSISDYYLPREEAIEFLIEAFDELEKCRTFLKWTYPFLMLEFDEKFATNGISRNPYKSKEQIEELRAEFDLLQASLEYKAESLSNLIARRRVRSTKQSIMTSYHAAKSKRLEFEQLVFHYYASNAVQSIEEEKAVSPASATSSLTTESKEKQPKVADRKPHLPRGDSDEIQEKDIDAVLRGITNMSPLANTAKKPIVDDSSSSGSSSDDHVAFQKPTLQHKPSSYFQAAVNIAPPAVSPPATKSRSFYRTNSAGNVVASMPSPEIQKVSSDSSEESLPATPVMPAFPESLPSPASGKSLFRVGSTLNRNLVANSSFASAARKTVIIHSLHKEEVKPEPEPEPEPPRPPTPPPVYEAVAPPVEPTRIYEVIRETAPVPQLPQYIMEQRMIAAKKDPDQEALEHAIMISKQEEDYGINMYDALTDSDETAIEDYIVQGFTREEAILIIFEEKMGISRGQAITPAMPTLHKVEGSVVLTEAMEKEIEGLMRKGYTREQAIEVAADRQRRPEPVYHPPSMQAPQPSPHPQLLSRVGTGWSNSSGESGPRSPPTSGGQTPASPVDDDARIAQLMARGMTMEQALAMIHEERRVHSNASVADDQRSRGRSMDLPSTLDEDPEIAHLMSKGYTRDQAVQVASSQRRPQQRPSFGSYTEEFTARSTNREANTQAHLQRLTSPPQDSAAPTRNRSIGSNGPMPAPAPAPAPAQRSSFYAAPVPAPMPAPSMQPQAGRSQIFRATTRDMYDQSQDEQWQQPPGQPNGVPVDFLPPPRPNRSGAGTGTGSGSTVEQGGNYNGSSYYGSTVVGDYSEYPQPVPVQGEDSRASLLAQQNVDFGMNMYEAMTPADGPEIRRLMGEGYSEDDAIQMIFDYRYRTQPQQQQQQQQVLPPPPPQQHLPPPQPHRGPPPQMHPQGPPQQIMHPHPQGILPAPRPLLTPQSSWSSNQSIQQQGMPGMMPGSAPAPGPRPMLSPQGSWNAGRGAPQQLPLPHQQQQHQQQSVYQHPPQGSSRALPAPTHSTSAPAASHSGHDLNTAREDHHDHPQSPDGGRKIPGKKLVSRVSSMFGKDKVTIEGDPMTHAMRQSQAETAKKPPKMKYKPSDVKQLRKMGFNEAMAVQALLENDNDVNAAANALMNA